MGKEMESGDVFLGGQQVETEVQFMQNVHTYKD